MRFIALFFCKLMVAGTTLAAQQFATPQVNFFGLSQVGAPSEPGLYHLKIQSISGEKGYAKFLLIR